MQSSATSRVAGKYSNDRPRTGVVEPREHFGLEAFDVDFDEVGLAMALDQRLQRNDLDALAARPAHALEAWIALHVLDPVVRQRRDRRRALADEKLGEACAAANGERHDLDARIATVEPAQDAHEVGLRLDRHHARAEPAPAAHAVAGMRTDVEAQRPGPNELRIETAQPPRAQRNAVIHRQ